MQFKQTNKRPCRCCGDIVEVADNYLENADKYGIIILCFKCEHGDSGKEEPDGPRDLMFG